MGLFQPHGGHHGCDEQIDLNVEGRAAMAAYRTLDDLHAADVKGKRVLVRADLNVPMKNGRIADVLHIERPGGKVVPSMSLKPVAAALTNFVGQPVRFAEDCIGEKAIAKVAAMRD